MWDICTTEYYSTMKKKEILQFVRLWMTLEGVMLSDVKVRERKLLYGIIYVESRKTKLIETESRGVFARGWRK